MNYKIPENEVENILSIYWQMLREIETHTRPQEDPYNAMLVRGAYKVLKRCSIYDGKPEWEK